MPTNYPKTKELLAAVSAWTRPLIEHTAFRQLARSKIGSAFDWQDDWSPEKERISEVLLPEPLATQHEMVIQFYNLWQAAERVKTVEFYFRRYPFHGLPVSQHEHIANVCTLFFSSFYVFEERLRVYLNALNAACAPSRVDVGKALKTYRQHFKAELRERHGDIHFEPFDDLTIHAVMLDALRPQAGIEPRRLRASYAYRKATREWAGHARKGGQRVAAFLEGACEATLPLATFLSTPPQLGEDDLTVR